MISENRPDRPDILRLRHHPDDLFALVGATAEHLGLDPAFVEKDFWVTELLRSLIRPLPDNSGGQDVTVVFKGGTSLSKVYRLVDRFSEDVDVLLVYDGVGTGQRDRVLKYLCERIGADLDLDSDACRLSASTRGVKRNVRYHYPRRMPSPVITEGVLLEMGIRGGPEPNAVHSFRSLAAHHGIEVIGDSPDTWAEYAPVEIAVLGAERTLVEKLSLLHGRALRLDDEPEALLGAGRHYYDIYRVLASPDVRQRLESLPGVLPPWPKTSRLGLNPPECPPVHDHQVDSQRARPSRGIRLQGRRGMLPTKRLPDSSGGRSRPLMTAWRKCTNSPGCCERAVEVTRATSGRVGVQAASLRSAGLSLS
jgi:hypothetical protein